MTNLLNLIGKAHAGTMFGIKFPDSRFNNLTEVIFGAISWLLIFSGSLAVIAIIWSGIMYITAGGDAEKAVTARKNLTWAIIGVIVLVLSYFIVNEVNRIVGGGTI